MLWASPMWSEAEQIIKDEGIIYEVYRGPKGNLHAGIGHLLEEGEYELGDQVSKEQVSLWFKQDYIIAREAVQRYAPDAPPQVRGILTNMAFNLGEPRLFSFERLRKAIWEEDWNEAAFEMRESLWYDDVGFRSRRLFDRMLRYGSIQRIQSE